MPNKDAIYARTQRTDLTQWYKKWLERFHDDEPLPKERPSLTRKDMSIFLKEKRNS